MKHTDTTPWTAGHIAGRHRGQQDATAEAAGRYTRDPDHTGHPDEPPAHLTGADRDQWIDGFLTGYADGRSMRGAA